MDTMHFVPLRMALDYVPDRVAFEQRLMAVSLCVQESGAKSLLLAVAIKMMVEARPLYWHCRTSRLMQILLTDSA